ncbi:phage tail protein [Haloplanus sp. GCM10025708]|uniref:phage tail protein n=1 Tax=Haloferacaceae TaxID=1644056 RepID=UPI00360CCFAA
MSESDVPDDLGARRPCQRHRFVVDVDGLPELGFTEVRGLEVSVDDRRDGSTTESDSGGWWNRTGGLLDRLVDRGPAGRRRETTSPNLELRRGVTGDPVLWDWLQGWVGGGVEPRTVSVYLVDDAGDAAVGWVCPSATPVEWTGPNLRADDPGVAMEKLELAHDGLDAATATARDASMEPNADVGFATRDPPATEFD